MTPRREPGTARWRCHTCGAGLASWAAAERHADEHHGARLDLELRHRQHLQKETP